MTISNQRTHEKTSHILKKLAVRVDLHVGIDDISICIA
jgi:hypothetical protein